MNNEDRVSVYCNVISLGYNGWRQAYAPKILSRIVGGLRLLVIRMHARRREESQSGKLVHGSHDISRSKNVGKIGTLTMIENEKYDLMNYFFATIVEKLATTSELCTKHQSMHIRHQIDKQ